MYNVTYRILAAVLMLSATPALAANCNSQTPPSPSGNMSPSSSCNSLPAGSATARFPTFGGDLNSTRVGPSAAPVRRQRVVAIRRHAPRIATPSDQPVLVGAE